MPTKTMNPDKQNLWAGFLFGVGLVTFIDETVFHQLLHWHHFYDHFSTETGLVSDGFFHVVSWFATIGGLFWFAELCRRNRLWLARWWGGVWLGAGVFQLYDGTIQHKVLRLHQIRNDVDLLPYDLVWNLTAVLMIAVGVILLRRAQEAPSR